MGGLCYRFFLEPRGRGAIHEHGKVLGESASLFLCVVVDADSDEETLFRATPFPEHLSNRLFDDALMFLRFPVFAKDTQYEGHVTRLSTVVGIPACLLLF